MTAQLTSVEYSQRETCWLHLLSLRGKQADERISQLKQ